MAGMEQTHDAASPCRRSAAFAGRGSSQCSREGVIAKLKMRIERLRPVE